MAEVIGFIGLGDLGTPTTEELLQAGYRVPAVGAAAAVSADACARHGAEAFATTPLFSANGDAQRDNSGISKPIGGVAWDDPVAPQSDA